MTNQIYIFPRIKFTFHPHIIYKNNAKNLYLFFKYNSTIDFSPPRALPDGSTLDTGTLITKSIDENVEIISTRTYPRVHHPSRKANFGLGVCIASALYFPYDHREISRLNGRVIRIWIRFEFYPPQATPSLPRISFVVCTHYFLSSKGWKFDERNPWRSK